MRFLTLPPLVVLLLLVFLWFILLVLLLWFAMKPRRLEDTDKRADPKVHKKRNPSRDSPPVPARRRVAVHQTPPKDTSQDDAFDGFNRPANRRDDFDF